MDNIRIAILTTYDKVCAFMDNEAPKALHYYDDELHQYLQGTANTLHFKTPAKHEDSVFLTAGNKLAFTWRKKGYYFNIMQVTRTEKDVEIEAYSLNFELLNEQLPPYKSEGAMTFAQYLKAFDFEGVVTLKANEVSDKSISHEWEGSDTILARIFSLATVFDAEAEFIPELNDDYSLKRIILNAYRRQSDSDQGIGRERSDVTLRYGVNVSGVKKTCDILDIYTAIRPTGKDGLMVYDLDKTELDADGRVEYQSLKGDGCIRAVQARDRFPSNVLSGDSDRYITVDWSYDTDNVNMLYGQALAELKKHCVPKVSYEVGGYFDTDIGDVVKIADEEFNPPLYLQARVTEQVRSFTNPTNNKTTFDNFKELQSKIDPMLLQKMQELIAEHKTYACSIITDNGIVFKNGKGTTTLTASMMDGGKDVTGDYTIRWYKDGEELATGLSVTVSAVDITDKAVYRFEARNPSMEVKGFYEVTVTNVADGEEGNGISQMINYYLATPEKSGVTPDTAGWTKEPQTMTAANKYLWNYTVIEYTNGMSKATVPAIIGTYGDAGPQGSPGGIVVSDTEPADKYVGMLWKHTGSAPGLIKGATYRWSGAGWELFKFQAANMEAESLSAISANLGTVNAGTINGVTVNGSEFNNKFNVDVSTNTRIVGATTMSAGKMQINYTEQQRGGGSVWNDTVKGSVTLDYAGLMYTLRDASGHLIRSTMMGPDYPTFTLYNTNVILNQRITAVATSDTWLNIAAVPYYNYGNRYLVMANCPGAPLLVSVRDDGRLIAWGPTIKSGAWYTVDCMVLQRLK